MPNRTLIRWVIIPGVSLGALVLSAALAFWFTRPAPAPPPPPPEVPAPANVEPPDAKPPPVAPPPAFPSPREPARVLPTEPSPPDPRRVEEVEPVIESTSGRIDPEDIRRAIRAVSPLMQQCFEDVAQRNRGAQEVKLRFTVEGRGEEGILGGGELLASTIPDPMVQACMLDSLLDARFSGPAGGGKATVVYPFRFRAPGEAGP